MQSMQLSEATGCFALGVFCVETEKKKIVLIGPVYPYKTGLSYYVSLLYNKLKETSAVKLYSYSMQYPKLLYKKPQKDYDDDTIKVDGAEFILNSANPISWIKLAKKINKDNPDLIIFQWLHPYFAPCYWSITKMLRHTKILYICHNAIPHERFICDSFLTKVALKQADCIIAHSESDKDILSLMLPKAVVKVNPHPAYNFFKIKNMSKLEARSILGIREDAKVLLFFGLVREYKGLSHLLNAMPEIVARFENIKLVIAGDFGGNREKYDEIISALRIEENVDVYAGHIPVPEVEKFFAASDIVVLPYETATQSGVIQAAYGFNKPVLATNVGGLPDAVENMRTGYVVEPKNPSAIARAVEDYFNNCREKEFEAHIKEAEYRFSWDRMAETVYEFMQ